MYWTRIAAAVTILVLGGWLITTQLVRKQGVGLASSDNKKNIVPSKKNGSDQKILDVNSSKTGLSDAAVNNNQPALQQNIPVIKNQSTRNSGTVINMKKAGNDLSGKNNLVQPSSNQDQRNPATAEDPDGSNLAMQKSSAQELQPVGLQNDADPKQISALSGEPFSCPADCSYGYCRKCPARAG